MIYSFCCIGLLLPSLNLFLGILIFLNFYCAGWGYTVAVTNVLTIYQMYHTWIHPLHHSYLSLHPWNSFNRYHFSIYIHVYTVFVPYSPSYTLSLPPPHSYWSQPSWAGPVPSSCSLIFWMRKKWHFYLFKIATQAVSIAYLLWMMLQ
jgi:hypothetical protein